ncbi:hypothetical protein DPEC_G00364610 [Dallia pectoralis]|nr:hypothetical protein DPEC_G00364610 [Dallia pectoralis]
MFLKVAFSPQSRVKSLILRTPRRHLRSPVFPKWLVHELPWHQEYLLMVVLHPVDVQVEHAMCSISRLQSWFIQAQALTANEEIPAEPSASSGRHAAAISSDVG